MNDYPKLTSVTPLDDFLLELVFNENEVRVYDFKPNLNHKFYRDLADIKLFRNVTVEEGEIEWVTGQDFCPYTLYEQSTLVSNDNS